MWFTIHLHCPIVMRKLDTEGSSPVTFCLVVLSSRSFLAAPRNSTSLLVVQCNNAAANPNLVACAQHICYELKNQYQSEHPVFMLFLLQLEYKKAGFKVLGVSQVSCTCVHIDELREPNNTFPSLIQYVDQPLSSIFNVHEEPVKEKKRKGSDEVEDMEVDPPDEGTVRVEDVDSDDDDDVGSGIVVNKVHQAVSIMKSCLQASTKELNELRPMEISEVTDIIKTMNDQLTCNDQGVYLGGFNFSVEERIA